MKIADKVRKIRELRQFSQEYMASKLEMSQNNYSKLEKEEIRMTVDRLAEIAKILEIDPVDIIRFDENTIFNHDTSDVTEHQDNSLSDNEKMLYEKIIKSQEEQIELLKRLLESK